MEHYSVRQSSCAETPPKPKSSCFMVTVLSSLSVLPSLLLSLILRTNECYENSWATKWPRPEEPRTKPKVKIRESERKKRKKRSPSLMLRTSSVMQQESLMLLSNALKQNALRRMILKRSGEPLPKYGTEDEAEEPPKPDPVRPPTGESSVPDGEGSSDPKVAKGVEVLKKEAKSLHHLMTHVPKNPYCSVCNQAKMYKAPGYRTDGLRSVSASCFGDHITADHVVLYRDSDNMIEEFQIGTCCRGHCYFVYVRFPFCTQGR